MNRTRATGGRPGEGRTAVSATAPGEGGFHRADPGRPTAGRATCRVVVEAGIETAGTLVERRRLPADGRAQPHAVVREVRQPSWRR